MPPSLIPQTHPPVQSRGLSLLLASAGIAAFTLAWHGLVGMIPPDQAWSSMAARLGSGALALLPGAIVLWLMIVTQMAARILSGRFNPTEVMIVGLIPMTMAFGDNIAVNFSSEGAGLDRTGLRAEPHRAAKVGIDIALFYLAVMVLPLVDQSNNRLIGIVIELG